MYGLFACEVRDECLIARGASIDRSVGCRGPHSAATGRCAARGTTRRRARVSIVRFSNRALLPQTACRRPSGRFRRCLASRVRSPVARRSTSRDGTTCDDDGFGGNDRIDGVRERARVPARASLRQPRARESFLGVRARPSRCRANALRNPSPRWLACPPSKPRDRTIPRPLAPTRHAPPAPARLARPRLHARRATTRTHRTPPTDPDPDPDLADVELDRDRTLLTKMTSGSIDLDRPASSRTETGEIAATDSNPNEPEPRFLSRPGRDPGALTGARERAGTSRDTDGRFRGPLAPVPSSARTNFAR